MADLEKIAEELSSLTVLEAATHKIIIQMPLKNLLGLLKFTLIMKN